MAALESSSGFTWISQAGPGTFVGLNSERKIPNGSKMLSQSTADSLMSRLHFVIVPVFGLGNWIPEVLQQWTCEDHNCGLDQLVVHSPGSSVPYIITRLDARYDWLPSPSAVFQNKTFQLVGAADGCQETALVKGKIASVTASGCSYFAKVSAMEKSGALGVIVVQDVGSPLEDMNCEDSQCNTPLSIPATMIHGSNSSPFPITGNSYFSVRFQNTPSDSFFLALDRGRLAEVGWFLYPTFRFLTWQAEWFNFQSSLRNKLAEEAKVITIFNQTIMQGKGAVSMVTLPSLSELKQYSKLELDFSMSCPGSRDTSCPHWDHTVQLFVCCNQSSPLCGQELGRWISPFRRRIGRWLTDVTPLFPLLVGPSCTFTLKTVPWAMAWITSLNLRLTEKKYIPLTEDKLRLGLNNLYNNVNSGYGDQDLDRNSNIKQEKLPGGTLLHNNVFPMSNSELWPYEAHILYQPEFTFDKKYNSHFQPYYFIVPAAAVKVLIVAVITGHGSDENGCGEFCVTSHHFGINGVYFNRTFDTAGSPLGCAEKVSRGVLPNEHGTWLYGRDGWCDGQEVEPWVIDVSAQVKKSGTNKINYFGWFNGTDPNPQHNPGVMIFYSYLVFYK